MKLLKIKNTVFFSLADMFTDPQKNPARTSCFAGNILEEDDL